MKTFKINIFIAIIASLAITFQSCKAKKIIAKPAPPAETANKPPVVEHKQQTPPPAVKPAPVPQKPDFNFKNIQFDYNSAVLRTSAIQYLDHIVDEMKKDPSAKFVLNGNASSEGTAKHNMSLSIDRANAVKLYLTNAGLDVSNISVKGYGAKKPMTSNKTEKGRELNRRVEVKLIH
jgi:OOP family OmpA-OmpF porin